MVQRSQSERAKDKKAFLTQKQQQVNQLSFRLIISELLLLAIEPLWQNIYLNSPHSVFEIVTGYPLPRVKTNMP